MPIKIKTDLEFGDTFYVKTDEDQFPHQLIGVVVMPGNQFKFILSYYGEVTEVWDFEVTREPDKSRLYGDIKKKDDDE